MQPGTSKKRYCIDDYISPNRANPQITSFNLEKNKITCLCSVKDEAGLKCFKCQVFVHQCLANPNRGKLFECSSCLNRALDPMNQVRKILVESYFKTFSIFEYINIFNFQFLLRQEDLSFPVEVRGLVPDSTSLTWPMQGAFYINEEKSPIHDLKPLLYNSNRKGRRQQYFVVPSDKLKAGKNIIRFKIPCLDRNKFTTKFQYQEKKIYYMAVNSIERLTPESLQTQTFRERRVEEIESLKMLKSNNADIEVVSNKVCLICPYTRERIKVPVRGRYCQHFSCICLRTLIASHSYSRYWGCPICQLKLNQPYIDVWIYNMLKDNQQGSDVLVKQDGSYQWIKNIQNIPMDLDSEEDSPINQQPNPLQTQITKIIIKAENKIENPSISMEKDIQKNIISIDDDDQQILLRQQRKKNEILSRVKEIIKHKPSQLSQTVSQSLKVFEKLGKMKQVKDNTIVPSLQMKRKQEKLSQKQRIPIVTDIKVLQMRQLKFEQFKKVYFKTKVNPYRKYLQTEEVRRLFKQVF